jgi:hypothetical protein
VKPAAEANRTVVLAANSAWNILNFRMNLLRALKARGLSPVVLAPRGEGEAELRAAGVRVQAISMSADDTSPLSGFILVVRYIQALRRIRPAAFLGFTPKPNIFGSMAASGLKIPVINNVTGLGTAFIHGGVLGALVPNLYRVALRSSHRVFFHNDEDRTYLPDDILCKVDRASMAVSLETRVPFLDHRVAEVAARIPMHMKIHGRTGKHILRELLYRHAPRELFQRPKAGFAIPVGQWIRGPLRDWADDLLDPNRMASEGWFDPAIVQRRWRDHVAGRSDSTPAIWAILMFQAWQREQREPLAKAA